MSDLRRERLALATGVELDVTVGGAGDPIIFLHGFPESARTWHAELVDLARDHRVMAPDQRGFARSDKPATVGDYAIDRIVGDVLALADALAIDRFTLVGHDWGGAAAWATAIGHPQRVSRLIIANAPHPLIFQRTILDDPEQRAASQYIRAFREPGMGAAVAAMGLDRFFAKTFGAHTDLAKMPAELKAAYLDEWAQPGAIEGMLNWYKASGIVVPAPGEAVARPDWVDAPFPPLKLPVLVIWGMGDQALRPSQLDGLDAVVEDLTVVRVPDAGHFVTWEAPAAVIAAIRGFLAAHPLA